MNLKQTILMAMKSVRDSKVRAILTTLGIIVGVASVITLVSLVEGYQRDLVKQFEAFGTNVVNVSYHGDDKTVIDDFLKYSKEELSQYISGISANASTYTKIKFKQKGTEARVVFADSEYSRVNDQIVTKGRDINAADINNHSRVAVIGEAVRKEFFPVANPIGKTIKIKGVNYTVIGVYKGKFGGEKYSADNMCAVPSTLYRKLLGTSKITEYVVRTNNADHTKQYTDSITAYIKDNSFSAYSNDETLKQIKEMTRAMSLIAGAIASVSLLVGGIGIMNIMFVTVTERTREIGIRMAIGARRKDIVLQFLIESATVSAIGGVIGILLGTLFAVVGGALFLKNLYYPSLGLVIGSFTFSASIGLIFGIFPANKASKLQPVDALRTQ